MVQSKRALHCEEDFQHLVLRSHQTHSPCCRLMIAQRVQAYNCLVDEASITRIKEVPEILTKLLEDEIDYFGLNSRSKLLVKVELLNDQVVIIFESFFDVLGNTHIQVCRQVVGADSRVCLLHLFDPDIKLVYFDHEHGLKVDFRCH